MGKRRVRLDELLLEQGHVADPRLATSWIMSGKVVCDDKVITKPGQLVSTESAVRIRGVRLKYASRGGYKLEHALGRFEVAVSGWVALDVGASTGGFTDCLLQAGAAKVNAVDVGYGQLRGALAVDPRVRVLERTNVGDLSSETFPEPLDLAVVDLSYLSLLKAIPTLARCFVQPVRMICLVKPLYEGLDRRSFDDKAELRAVLGRFLQELEQTPYPARDITVSPILGGSRAVEFLVLIDDRATGNRAATELVERAFTAYERHPPISPEALGASAEITPS